VCKGGTVSVGIVGGTGPLGKGLSLRLAAAGDRVVVGSRDPARAASVVEELVAPFRDRPLSIEGAGNPNAAEADVVMVATPWEGVVATVLDLSELLSGKVVISVGSALIRQGREMMAVSTPRGSVAAALQAALPQSLVVGACHHLPASKLLHLEAPVESDVLVCSDHEEAKASTMELLASIVGLRPLDAGSLAASGAIEAFTAVLATLNIRYKVRSSLRLAGLDRVSSTQVEARRD
jgi:8-hydroxy-5-deazaflavin:NADPH oxidoreductase